MADLFGGGVRLATGNVIVQNNGEDTQIVYVDTCGNEHLVAIPSNMGSGTLSYSPSMGVMWAAPDADAIIRQALENHESDGSTEMCEDGCAHFFKDGSVAVQCRLPCDNSVHFLAKGDDVMGSCDIAIKELENMKKAIERMQEKVFELSLQQRKNDD